jgi:hypothetical protein
MSRIIWSVVAVGAIIQQKQALRARSAEIAVKIKTRFIPIATPGEAVELIKIYHNLDRLQERLVYVINNSIDDFNLKYPDKTPLPKM